MVLTRGRRDLRAWVTAALAALACSPATASATYQVGGKWGTTGSGDGQFSGPMGIAANPADIIYVSDTFNHRIQRFDSSGTFLGEWGMFGSGNGQFSHPFGIATDAAGNVYVADTNNHRIQKFSSTGAFLGKWGNPGSGNGQLSGPRGVATDAAGNVYVADYGNHRIQKFSSGGAFLAKWGTLGGGDGQFNLPIGITADAAGNVYVADTANQRIQKFSSTGAFIAKWGESGTADGELDLPSGLTTDDAGNVLVADTYNNRVQKFSSTGAFLAKWGGSGSGDGQFALPAGIATGPFGDVYVADTNNDRVQRFVPVAPDTTIASGPPPLGNDTTPTFTFTSAPAGAGFECRVEGSGQPFAPCTTPHTTSELEDGLNIFLVRALDPHAIPDPTPAEWGFRLDATPPQTFLDSGPPARTRKRRALFRFSSSERGSFQCKLDKAPFRPCGSPFARNLRPGRHTFKVRAVDRAGNRDRSPAVRRFRIG